MCRQKDLFALCIISFGTGLLLGRWIHSFFWCTLGGIALICGGVFLLRRRW